jgi:hypothetical protein
MNRFNKVSCAVCGRLYDPSRLIGRDGVCPDCAQKDVQARMGILEETVSKILADKDICATDEFWERMRGTRALWYSRSDGEEPQETPAA